MEQGALQINSKLTEDANDDWRWFAISVCLLPSSLGLVPVRRDLPQDGRRKVRSSRNVDN